MADKFKDSEVNGFVTGNAQRHPPRHERELNNFLLAEREALRRRIAELDSGTAVDVT